MNVTGLAAMVTHEEEMRAKLKQRLQMPPDVIKNGKQALQAWHRYRHYRGMASSAHSQFMRAPGGGSVTARKQHARFLAYSDVYEAWENALEAWMQTQAGL